MGMGRYVHAFRRRQMGAAVVMRLSTTNKYRRLRKKMELVICKELGLKRDSMAIIYRVNNPSYGKSDGPSGCVDGGDVFIYVPSRRFREGRVLLVIPWHQGGWAPRAHRQTGSLHGPRARDQACLAVPPCWAAPHEPNEVAFWHTRQKASHEWRKFAAFTRRKGFSANLHLEYDAEKFSIKMAEKHWRLFSDQPTCARGHSKGRP